jgi:hypothetical protein
MLHSTAASYIVKTSLFNQNRTFQRSTILPLHRACHFNPGRITVFFDGTMIAQLNRGSLGAVSIE